MSITVNSGNNRNTIIVTATRQSIPISPITLSDNYRLNISNTSVELLGTISNAQSNVKFVGSGAVNITSNSTAIIIDANIAVGGEAYTVGTLANTTAGSNVRLTSASNVNTEVKFVGGGIVNVQSNSSTITISAPSPADNNTTYDLTLTANASIANLQLVGSDTTTDVIRVTGNGAINVISNSTYIVVSAPVVTDTDTTYTLGVLANTTAGSNVRLTSSGNVNTDVKIIGSGIVNVQSNSTVITINVPAPPTDNNTTYDLTLGAANTTVANLQLVGSDATTDIIRVTGNGAVNVISNTTHIIVSAPVVTDTDTTYSLSTLANTTAGANVRLTSVNNVNTEVRFIGSGIVNVQSNTTAITINAAAPTVNTYTLSAPANTTSANLTLTASGGAVNNVRIAGSGSVTVSANSSNGITIAGTDNDTTYSFAVLANTTAGSNVRLTSSGNVNTDVKIIGAGIVNVQSNTTVITINAPAPTDNNTTYDLSLGAANTTVANLQLVGSDATTDVVRVTGNGAVNVISNATHIVVSAPVVTDTDTTYSISTLANTTAGSNVRLTSSGNVNTDVKIIGSGVANVQSNSTVITVNVPTPTDTTYTISTLNTTGGANVRLTSSGNANDDIKITGTGTVTVTQSADVITIDGAAAAAAPGGSNTHVQYNDSGALNGTAGFTYDESTNNVLISNTLTVSIANVTTGANVGANVNITTARIQVGNSTANTSANSILIQTTNSTATANITPLGLVAGISTVNTIAMAVGANVISNSTASYVGNSTVNSVVTQSSLIIANSTVVTNVQIGVINVGNSTINTVANSTAIKLSNSTVNTTLIIPSAAQYGATNFVLHANGSWVQLTDNDTTYTITTLANTTAGSNVRLTSAGNVNTDVKIIGSGTVNVQSNSTVITIDGAAGAALPGGANTQIQYNDSGVLNGAAGFTYNETTNNVVIANTLTVANVSVGTDVNISTTSILVGNSTANTTANSILVQVANSTAIANISPLGLVVGTSIANTTVIQAANLTSTSGISGVTITASTSVSTGANVVSNTTAMFVGNSTVNATHNQTSFLVSNSTSYTNVQIGLVVVGNSTVNAVANSTALKLANSTVNTTFTLPNTAQYSATNAFLHANGSWVNVVAGGVAQTYTISTVTTTGGANVRLTSSDSTNDDIKFTGTGSVTVTQSGDVITIDGAVGAAAAGGSNTHVQFNNSTVLAGSAGFTFDTSSNTVTVSNTILVGNSTVFIDMSNGQIDMSSWGAASPPTPPANTLTIFARNAGGRMLSAIVGPSGIDTSLQPWLARNKIYLVTPVPNGTTFTLQGMTIANTLAYAARAPASGNLFLSMGRVAIASNTTAGTSAGQRGGQAQFWRGNAASLGGFTFVARFGISIVAADMRAFVGLKNSTTVFANGNPSAQTNLIGIGFDSTQTTWRIMTNGGAGTAPTIDLGSGFPCNTGNSAMYELAMYHPPNGSVLNYQVTNITTSNSVYGSITANSTNMPSSTTFLTHHFWINNGATAAAAALDIVSLYIETDL